jgi:hypothetical protein
MSKNPPDLGVDLNIAQLCEEGTVMTTWPQIHTHSHFSLMEWLNVASEKGLQEVHVMWTPTLAFHTNT